MRAAILAALLTGCISPNDTFECTSTEQCTNGGICQLDVHFCSFADPDCPSGQGYGPASGSLSNTCVPTTAVCGNGVVEDGEECEDGNEVDTDDCVACQHARCGDGKVRPGIEDCDDGNTMDGDGCNSLCITCEGDGVVVANGHCYMRVDAPLGFETARTDCAARGGFLAAISSTEENTVVTNLLAAGGGDYWFGMTDFSDGTFILEDESRATFMNFASGEPNGTTVEDCTSIAQASGQWADRDCATALPYVCEKAPFTIDATTRHAYLYVGGRGFKTFYDGARTNCTTRTGHLATITDAAEQAAIDAITSATSKWIGLNDKATEGTMAWETGEPTTFMNFASGQPDDLPNTAGAGADCVFMQEDGTWADQECDRPFTKGFVCEIDP